MGKKRRGHPNLEDILARPWCYYCERDFEDLKLLILHQKAKHFKCGRCGRRLNTAGGLSVHMNQVHKESLEHVENALSNRQGLDYEIFGMEGMPSEIFETHQQRLSQNYYEAQEKRRIVTGNPLPGQARQPSAKKKITIETEEELKRRLAEWRKTRVNVPVDAMEGVVLTSTPQQEAYDSTGLPQRPSDSQALGDDIDNLIRTEQAGIRAAAAPAEEASTSKPAKKEKEKRGRMIYESADSSPEEHIAALRRYAFTAA